MLLWERSHVFNLGMSEKTPLGTICVHQRTTNMPLWLTWQQAQHSNSELLHLA
jgi:hypothetical protein